MPRLTTADVHSNKLQTGIGIRYKNTQYIAGECSPVLNVKSQSNYYPSWPKSVWFRDEAGRMAPGTRAPVVGLNVTLTNRYQTERYGMAAAMPRDVMSNADSELALAAAHTELVTDKVLLAREIRVASMFQTAASWGDGTGTVLAGATCWDATDTCDIVANIDTAIEAVNDYTCGIAPNTIIIPRPVWRYVKRDPNIIAAIYGEGYGPKIVNKDRFADFFDLDKVLIGNSYKTTDEEDTDESGITYTGIWTDSVWVGYVSPAPSMFNPSAAYTFRSDFRVRTWYETGDDTDYVEASEMVDEKITASTSGWVISNCIA